MEDRRAYGVRAIYFLDLGSLRISGHAYNGKPGMISCLPKLNPKLVRANENYIDAEDMRNHSNNSLCVRLGQFNGVTVRRTINGYLTNSRLARGDNTPSDIAFEDLL